MSLSNSGSNDIIKILNNSVTESITNSLLARKSGSPITPPISELRAPWTPPLRPQPLEDTREPIELVISKEVCNDCPACRACLDKAYKEHSKEYYSRLDQITKLERDYAAEAAKCMAAFIQDLVKTGAEWGRMLEFLLQAVWNLREESLDPYFVPTVEFLWELLTSKGQEGCINGCAGSLPVTFPVFPLTHEQQWLLRTCGAACYSRVTGGVFPPDFKWEDTKQLEYILYKFLYNETLGGQGLSVQPGITLLTRILLCLGSLGIAKAASDCWDAAYSSWIQNKKLLERLLLWGPPYPAFVPEDLHKREKACIRLVLPLCAEFSNETNEAN